MKRFAMSLHQICARGLLWLVMVAVLAPAAMATTSADDARPAVAEPGAVVRFYYAAINAGELRCAYAAWANDGKASGQSYAEFAAGYAHTQRVKLQLGKPGRVDAAAGSRYVTIPVTLEAARDDGSVEHFSGQYVLRRAVVPGATRQQRQWQLYTAEIEPAPSTQ